MRDPVELEIFKSLFHSIAEEMGAALRRTAFSPNIKERRDYSCAVFDGAGEVVAMGVPRALMVARALHLLMLGLLVALLIAFGLGKLAMAGVAVVALLLAYEHSLVSSGDLSKLNAAFFTMNGVIAVVFFVFVAADLLVRTTHP